jgi:D-lactate dehydrogenase (cytochrome)
MPGRVPEAVLDALRARLGDRVSTAAADLEAASHDASSQPAHRPDVVAWPRDTDEVRAVVGLAAGHGIPLTPRAGGSSLEGNPIPTAGGIVLDCSRMARITAIRPEDLQVDVEPGVVYARLNASLRPHGLFFPPSPGGSADWATVGGMVANNASGLYSVKYGGTRDHVRAVTVVTGTGELVRLGNRCRKSASGYHLLGLIVGSEGTLGIITELTLALAGLPAARRRGGFVFPDAGAAARVVADLVRFGVDVAALEFLDARTIAALNRFQAFGLAERPTLLLEVHGTDATVDEVWATAAEVAAAAAGVSLRLPDPWTIRELATRAVEAQRRDAVTVRADLAIPIGALPELVRACEASAGTSALPMHVFGHAGIGILHVLVLAGPDERAAAESARDALVERALALGGACSGEHGMGTGNRRFAAREHGPALALMRGVKAVFDPHGILNPGKIW